MPTDSFTKRCEKIPSPNKEAQTESGASSCSATAAALSFNVDVFDGVGHFDKLLVKPPKGSPDSFGNLPRGALGSKHVTRKALPQRVLRDEPKVLVIFWVVPTEGDVLQVEKIIMRWHMVRSGSTTVHHSKTQVGDFENTRVRTMDTNLGGIGLGNLANGLAEHVTSLVAGHLD